MEPLSGRHRAAGDVDQPSIPLPVLLLIALGAVALIAVIAIKVLR